MSEAPTIPETTSEENTKQTPAAIQGKDAAKKSGRPHHQTDTQATNNNDKKESPPKAAPAKTKEVVHKTKATKKSANSTLSVIALMIAAGGLGAGYLGWQHINAQQAELLNRIDSTEQAVSGAQSTSASAQNTNQALKNELNALTTQINSELDTIKQNNAGLNESIASLGNSLKQKSPNDWLIAEARHLINIANHQAQLNHNVAAAITALETADQRLRDTVDPSLIKVRQTITDDLVALRGVPKLDTPGIALTLSQLQNSIEQLPVINDVAAQTFAEDKEATTNIEVNDIKSFFYKVWSDIKSLVTIRRDEGPQGVALLPPDQRFFLQQNLRLKLETARLALLQNDNQSFHGSLDMARSWIETYFDTGNAATASIIETINSYKSIELQPTLPDISNSLRALDKWQSRQKAAS